METDKRFTAATDRLQEMLKGMKENGDIGQYILLCEDGDDFMHMVSITNASVSAVTRMLHGFACGGKAEEAALAFTMALAMSEEFRENALFLMKNPELAERFIDFALTIE